MEYKPKSYRAGINPPFGYYVCPTDHKVLIPDPVKLDALHYAYRMRAKHRTPYRDCTQWLHAATGQRISAAGFMLAYKKWVKTMRSTAAKEMHVKKKKYLREHEKFVDDNFSHFGIIINDTEDIAALAHAQARKEIQEKEQGTGQSS